MSTVQLNHQRPQVLDPLSASLHLRGDHDVPGLLEQMVCEPVFVPLSPSQPVSLVVDGQDVDVQDLSRVVMSAIDEVLDTGAQDVCNQVMQQALTSWDSDSRVPTDELMVVQAAAHHRLPSPRRAVYSARTDVIPAAKEILATGQDDGNLLVALGYAYHPRTLGFWFRDEAAFSEFTQWLTTTSQNFVSRMDPDQAKMLNELCRLSLKDLTESLVLRKDDNDSLEEYSFARVLVWALTTWCSKQRQAVSSGTVKDLLVGPLAFSLSETLLPRTVVLVNVERHARASVRRVDREWRIITETLTNPVKMVTPGRLSKLTALERARAGISNQAANAVSNATHGRTRSGKVVFRRRRVTTRDISRAVIKVVSRMGRVNRSMNAIRQVSTSYARANRRHPDDPNRPGRSVSTRYAPDIHIYLDCSGSISQDNYQMTVRSLIALAKRLDVNLYLTSFSHYMSTPFRLDVKGRTVAQVWRQFSMIPKVDGGTDYKQIYDVINQRPARSRQLSLVITDFGWYPGSYTLTHPRNLYYVPISVSDGYEVDMLRRMAKSFVHGMTGYEPTIGSRLLGMTV